MGRSGTLQGAGTVLACTQYARIADARAAGEGTVLVMGGSIRRDTKRALCRIAATRAAGVLAPGRPIRTSVPSAG